MSPDLEFPPASGKNPRHVFDQIFRMRLHDTPDALTVPVWENDRTAQVALASPELNGRILDFGCGTGELDVLLARRGFDVAGYDVSTVAIDVGNQHRAAEPGVVQQRLNFVLGEGGVLPFADQAFDTVFCHHVFESIPHLTPVLKELARVLKPGGALLTFVSSGTAAYDITRANFFDAASLENRLADFFEEVDVAAQADGALLKAVCRNNSATRHPRIVCMMRIRNEERWIKEVMDSIARAADGIVIVDDGSTDNTPMICKFHPAVVDYHWQNELQTDQRRDKQLCLQMALAQNPDWILGLDADEALESSAAPRIFEAIRRCSPEVSILKVVSLFMWNDMNHYRTDGVYKRICQERLFRVAGQTPQSLQYQPTKFKGNGHCTRLPAGIQGRELEIDVNILHLGYMYPEVRARRYEYYRNRDPKEFANGDYAHLVDQPHQTIQEWRERPYPHKPKSKPASVHEGIAAGVKQEFKPDYYYANARRNLVELVPQSARHVLDVGCGHGMTGGLLRSERGIEVVGLEIHPETADIARQHLSAVVVGDIEQMDLPFEKGYFDCMIMGDVLEHLTNPWIALKKLAGYLKDDGLIVASIPNIRNLGIISKLLKGSWTYEEWGILDKTHLRFFALKDMYDLFASAGINARVVETVRDPLFENEMKSPPDRAADVDLGAMLLRAVSPDDLNEYTAQQFIFTGTKIRVAPEPKPLKQATPRPEVSVIIPVFNNVEYTRKCVTSLFMAKETVNFEVIVVDNGSSDETADYLRQLPPPVRTVSMTTNAGFAKGCNAGAKAALGRYVVFLNNDTIVQPNWLKAMIECVQRDPAIGLVGNLQIYPDSGKVQQAGIVCGADRLVYSIYNNDLPSDHPAANKAREFQFVAGSCMLLEKEFFDQLGGFDEAYLNSCEDIDLCLRVRAAGRKVYYCPQSRIYHYESRTVSGHDKNGANYQRFLQRWGDTLIRDDQDYLREDGFLAAEPVIPAVETCVPVPADPVQNDYSMPLPIRSSEMSESPQVAILTTYNQRCGLATYAEYMVKALRESGVDPLILAEKTTDLRGPDEARVARCWNRQADGGKEILNVLLANRVEVLHINFGGIFDVEGWLPNLLPAIRNAGIRIVTTFHTTESAMLMLGLIARRSDRVLVHHPQNKMELVALHAAAGRIECIPHGMPKVERKDIFEAKLELGWDPEQKTVGTFGFVEPHKGILEIIPAFQLAHEESGARLHVLGGPHPANPDSGKYLELCKQKAKECGLENAVIFNDGFLPEDELLRRLRACDVIVMNYTSSRYEASGATMLALSAGRPIISSSKPPFEYPSALTFKTTAAFHMEGMMAQCLKNPFLGRELLNNVLEYEKIAGWNVVADRIRGIYEAVCREPQLSDTDPMQYYATHPDDIYAEALQRERVRWLKERADGRILEIGPANGYVSEFVGGSAAVDINRGRLEVAAVLRPSVQFQFGNVVNGLPFDDKEFDQVLAPEILEHVDFDLAVKALRECMRVGKRVLITIPNADKPDYNPDLVHNPEHRWLVNRTAVDRLLQEAGCVDYELGVSDAMDFYLLDIRSEATKPRVRVHERAALLAAQALDLDFDLHIGVDSTALEDETSRFRGIGRYTHDHFAELMRQKPNWKFTWFGTHAAPDAPELQDLCGRPNGAYSRWRHFPDINPDVLYLTHPMSNIGMQVLQSAEATSSFVASTFYDLVPLLMADIYLKPNPPFANEYMAQLRLLQKRCDLFFCISQCTTQDLQGHMSVPLAKLRTIHGGIVPTFERAPSAESITGFLNRLGVKDKEFLLFVGVPDHRKNAAGMFCAMASVRKASKQNIPLVIAGEIPDSIVHSLEELAVRCGLPLDAVVPTGIIDDEEMNVLYHSANTLLFPSLYEGLGFPILEAMSAGLPVIAGDNSSQSEICGDAALLVEVRSVENIANAITRLYFDPELRAEMSRRGYEQQKQFTWKKTAEKTAIYLAEAIARRRQKTPASQSRRFTELVSA
jgi:GT2 family glycosyltransferase/glycosyltransferase involved in cell wall biosynthesis/ubiquinone/menaquinone biosynthesis C-methylase UbiE